MKQDRQEHRLCPIQRAMAEIEVTGDEKLARLFPESLTDVFRRKRRCSQQRASSELPVQVSSPQPAPRRGERQCDSAARGYHPQRSGDDVLGCTAKLVWTCEISAEPATTHFRRSLECSSSSSVNAARSTAAAASIQAELDEFSSLSLLTSELGSDSGLTGPNDWDREGTGCSQNQEERSTSWCPRPTIGSTLRAEQHSEVAVQAMWRGQIRCVVRSLAYVPPSQCHSVFMCFQ